MLLLLLSFASCSSVVESERVEAFSRPRNLLLLASLALSFPSWTQILPPVLLAGHYFLKKTTVESTEARVCDLVRATESMYVVRFGLMVGWLAWQALCLVEVHCWLCFLCHAPFGLIDSGEAKGFESFCEKKSTKFSPIVDSPNLGPNARIIFLGWGVQRTLTMFWNVPGKAMTCA